MIWSDFLITILLVYGGYYALNILYDLFIGGKAKPADVGNVHYEVADLLAQEPKAQPLVFGDGDEEEPASFTTVLTPAPAPVAAGGGGVIHMKVEAQGIPFSDFMNEAKSYATSIF